MPATPRISRLFGPTFKEKDRILLALIVNQYKQEVAAKYRINLKPVILFKATTHRLKNPKRTKEKFHKLIDDLTGAQRCYHPPIEHSALFKQAFQFFFENNISDDNLVERLKQQFQRAYCLSVNKHERGEGEMSDSESIHLRTPTTVFAPSLLCGSWMRVGMS